MARPRRGLSARLGLGGLAGAAEYETLAGVPGSASEGMGAQSLGHVAVLIFIVAGNALHFTGRLRRKREAR